MAERDRISALAVGTEIVGRTLVVTEDRIRWYGDAMLSASSGEPMRVGSNIHTDDQYAKSQGLPGAIADGMMSTNWLQNMVVRYFGRHYLESGELRTKFIKPIFTNVTLSCRGRVIAITNVADGAKRYELEIWCEDENGNKLTVGDAKIDVRPDVKNTTRPV